MSIKEIADLITKKNFVFQVSIPDTSFSHGKTTVNMALSDSESLESYFLKIAKANKASHLFIKLFSPNGSSYKPKGEHLIFLPVSEAVATATNVATAATNVATTATNVATPATNVATQKPFELAGLEEQVHSLINKQNKPAMNDKDYIDFKVLQSEHKRLEDSYSEAKARNAKLEKKIEDLHDENKTLLRDNNVKDDKHALALERTKLDIEKEGKEGLSGLFGELTKEPETLKMLIGLFKPDHPMFKETAEPRLNEGVDGVTEINYVQDSIVNGILNDIPRSLSNTPGETIANVYLVMKKLIAEPLQLTKALQMFVPELTN